FLARPEVAPLRTAWDEATAAGGDAPLRVVSEAATEGRLPLLASVLAATLPDCFEFGLGLAVAMSAAGQREAESADAVRAATTAREAAEEARRRAEAARSSAETELARLETTLRDERQARREREQQSAADSADSEARRAEVDAALADARQELAEAARRAAAAERRAADAEGRAVDAGARLAAAEDRATQAERQLESTEARPVHKDPLALEQVARAAEDLAVRLRRLADRPDVASPPPAPAPARRRPPPAAPAPQRATPATRTSAIPTRPRRRARVRIPPGMLEEDPAAIEAMVRTPGLAVIVDGYNVSMLAWPGSSAAEQRERLCDALAEFQLRFRCEVTVVFDGAEVPGVRPLRRRNVRVVFSAAGQEADEVVVGEVMFRPEDVPVIVVSSDREVQAGAQSEGASVLPSDAFLQLMRR
ncbi:MAG: NYN domain-containing protein, partial [Actinobacteria bacterium]|nr:NYN domain-containing protein [Actinomycetota bacterium]